MKRAIAWVLGLSLLGAIGCRSHDPPPSAGGLAVNAPGVRVNVDDIQGVSVNAPGANVRVQP